MSIINALRAHHGSVMNGLRKHFAAVIVLHDPEFSVIVAELDRLETAHANHTQANLEGQVEILNRLLQDVATLEGRSKEAAQQLRERIEALRAKLETSDGDGAQA